MPTKRGRADTIPPSKRQKVNGTAKSKGPQSNIPSVATIEEERAKLLEWLDRRDQDPKVVNIFTVATTFPVPEKKPKGRPIGQIEQLSLAGKDHMAVAYTISPSDKWNRLNKYKKFTLAGGVTHEIGSCVLVNHNEVTDGEPKDDEQWKAQILEVRALDSNHVYLRVVWLEIPSELPRGAQKHHARNELVVSNEMAIISANCVNGGIDVEYWEESNDDAPLPDPEKYFWRQTYDKKTEHLSDLRKVCVCEQPHNPDNALIRCTNSSCDIWLHAECLVNDRQKNSKTLKGKKAEGLNGAARSESPGDGKSREAAGQGIGGIEVDISVPNGSPPKLLIKDLHSKNEAVREEDVRCLRCKEVIV